jgi:Arc/MetJ-type ribon-helix-helix transcriptional regulator
MSTEIPSDLAPFVQRMVAERRFLTESDVLAEGLRLLQARETLRQEVRKGFEQLDAGLGIPADEVYTRVEGRITEIETEKRVR